MRFQTLPEWLAWQETLHPNEIELGLERVAQVLARLKLTHPTFTVITVAGTNGKGSSVAMLEAILLAAGYQVGSYTSPHLLRYNERIKLNGCAIDDRTLCESFERIDQARGLGSQEVRLTYFEFGTLAAIDIFQQAGVDVAVLEVGLGGRLDAVNVLDADVALITAIDIDHQNWLGDDRETIAREKAGILRAHKPAVCSDPAPPASLVQLAEEIGAPLSLISTDFKARRVADGWRWQGKDMAWEGLPLPSLAGDFQLANAAGVLAVLEHLALTLPVSKSAVCQGLQAVELPGRFQILPGAPMRILDVAHNAQSARVLAHNLSRQPCHGRTHVVFSMLADKDVHAVAESLRPVADHWYIASLGVPRSAPVEQLQSALAGASVEAFDHIFTAYQAAVKAAQEQDRIVIAGSFYTVAAVLGQAV